MVFVALEGRLAPHEAPEKCRGGVEYGDRKSKQRYGDREQRGTLCCTRDREASQKKAGKETSRVAEKRAGRGEIEREEPEDGSCEGRGNQADRRVAQRHRYNEYRR